MSFGHVNSPYELCSESTASLAANSKLLSVESRVVEVKVE